MKLGRIMSGRKAESNEELRCSFCKKSQDEVGKLISTPSDYPRAYICDECIRVCCFILEEDKPEAPGTYSLQKPV